MTASNEGPDRRVAALAWYAGAIAERMNRQRQAYEEQLARQLDSRPPSTATEIPPADADTKENPS